MTTEANNLPSPLDALTDKERLFVEHYLQCWNATKAARLAGYKDPEQSGWLNKKKVEIQAAIQARIAEVAMSADEVLLRLADQARSSMEDFLTVAIEDELVTETTLESDGSTKSSTKRIRRPVARLDLRKAAKAGKLHLVKKYSKTDKGVSIELYSSQDALELIGKHHGLFVERHELSGNPEQPLVIQVQSIDYRTAITALAPGPVGDRDPSGQD